MKAFKALSAFAILVGVFFFVTSGILSAAPDVRGTVSNDAQMEAGNYSSAIAAVTTLYDLTMDATDGGVQTISINGSTSDVDGLGTNIIQVDTTTLSSTQAQSVVIVVTESGSAQLDLAFHADWKWDGTEPASLAADAVGVLYIWSYGSAQANIVASWSEMQ